ncbi:hypothetical protein A6A27_33350 [Micromonospora sp. CB01531]|nr:hypothetical protein A6A27_33350 [Micromonospora sp. CB01531]
MDRDGWVRAAARTRHRVVRWTITEMEIVEVDRTRAGSPVAHVPGQPVQTAPDRGAMSSAG